MKSKCTIITVLQRKGGVGKSTATLNLAHVLASMGKRVVIVDMDDQQNTTSSVGCSLDGVQTVAELLLEENISVKDVLVATEWERVWMIPASANLSGVAKSLDGDMGGHLVLKEKLGDLSDFDFCLVDTGPSLNILNINSVCASDYLFMPLSSRLFSLQGLTQTLEAFNKARKRLNPGLGLLGMAFVIHDRRNTLANEIVGRVQKQYPSYLFDSIIGLNIKIEEAQVKKQSILTYAPGDRGSKQYMALGQEILARIERLEGGAP